MGPSPTKPLLSCHQHTTPCTRARSALERHCKTHITVSLDFGGVSAALRSRTLIAAAARMYCNIRNSRVFPSPLMYNAHTPN